VKSPADDDRRYCKIPVSSDHGSGSRIVLSRVVSIETEEIL